MTSQPQPLMNDLPYHTFFQALLGSLNSCTALTDGQGRILALNQAWETYPHKNPFVTGISRGSDFFAVCRSEAASGNSDLSSIAQGVLEVASGHLNRLSRDYPIHSQDQTRWYGLAAIRCDHDLGLGLVIHNIDITEKVEIKARLQSTERERALMEIQLRQSQKMEAIGLLSAGIAHEINTPIQYISDNLRFLAEAFEDLGQILGKEMDLLRSLQKTPELISSVPELLEWAESKEPGYLLNEVPTALRQSSEGVKRVSAIVQAMKTFSHPGVEGRAAVDLKQAIETTLLVSGNEWKNIAEVETDFDSALPPVNCYPGEINQVFLNLVTNAAHAIAGGAGETREKGLIRIQTRFLDGNAEIRISDTGPGIPEKIRDQIFLPFFTTKTYGRNTGQGLSIVHSVITKHGGSISFETEMGKGTCFIVRLPVNPPG